MDTYRERLADELLIRPTPLRGESLQGFMLRVADVNGCDGAIWAWRAWRPTSHMQSAEETLSQISAVTRIKQDQLRDMAHVQLNQLGSKCNWLGYDLPRAEFSVSPAVCPDCLDEVLATRGVWDLRLITMCPRHGCWLVTRCPSCSQPLRWGRRSVAGCHCGYDLRRAQRFTFVPSELWSITALMEEMLMGDLPHFPELTQGLPQFLRMRGIEELVGLVRRVAAPTVKTLQIPEAWQVLRRRSRDAMALTILSRCLVDWPKGFVSVLSEETDRDSPQMRRDRWRVFADRFAEFPGFLNAMDRNGMSIIQVLDDCLTTIPPNQMRLVTNISGDMERLFRLCRLLDKRETT